MLKISTDGGGVKVVVRGCPICKDKGSDNISYVLSSWWLFEDAGLYKTKIFYCPFCGEKLPALDGWRVING